MGEHESTFRKFPDKKVNVYERTSSDILKITEDKLKLKLIDLKGSIESKSNVFCYFGISVTILLVLLTADFKDWYLKPEHWRSLFEVAFLLMVFLTAMSGFSYWRNKRDIDSVISDIKKVT